MLRHDVTARFDFSAEPYFVIRAPAYPISGLNEWIAAADGAADEIERRSRLRSYLIDNFASSHSLREGLTLASPDAATALRAELDGEGRSEKQSRRLEQTLVKYFCRAHTRATPFGLFAGTAVGTFGPSTAMELGPVTEHRRVVRLDLSVLASMVERLSQRRDVRRASRYRVNSSLYLHAGRARYVERKGATHRDISYELAEVELTDALELVLTRCSHLGTWSELVALLCPEYGAVADIEEFLDDLIDAQVLVSELECPVTCDDALAIISNQLSSMEVDAGVVSALREIASTLDDLQRPGSLLTSGHLSRIQGDLACVGAGDFRENLLHVQLQLTPKAPLTLNERVHTEIEQAVSCLVRMSAHPRSTLFSAAEEELDAFRLAFQRRYDDAMVPLTTALDAENGIGFAGAWSASAVDRPPSTRAARGILVAWEGYLAERLMRMAPHRDDELELTSTDLEQLERDRGVEPYEFIQVFGRVESDSASAMDRGEFLVHIEQCAGPTESSLVARFAIGNDALTERLRETVRAVEVDEHRILAEVAHLPRNRAANVVARPRLSEYEIPYLARSEAPEARQITIRDLFLFIEAGRLVLWSQRLGKEVLPRLSSAHAALPKEQLPIYRFLYALHTQQRNCLLKWDWGNLAANGWLPRVRLGRAILALARWRISASTARQLQSATPQEQSALIASLRADLGIPRFVTIDARGQPLGLDLDNELARDMFVDELSAVDGSVLTELFPRPQSQTLVSPEGSHAFELVVPLRPKPRPSRPTKPRQSVRITHAPGGDWLTLKIYTGQVTADRILRDVLAPVVAELERSQSVARWFFLRYADPDFHLRIRFEGRRAALWAEVLPALHACIQPLIEEGSVFQTVVDSYRPELERYGGPQGMALAHDVFCADSRCVLDVLTRLPALGSTSDRILCATAGVNGYYDAFGEPGMPTLASSHVALERLASSVWRTREEAAAGKRECSATFRAARSAVEEVMATPTRGALAAAIEPIVRRGAQLSFIAKRMHDAMRAGQVSKDLTSLLLSYAHLHVNRMLRDYEQVAELRIYDSLVRHHESVAARARR